LAGRGHKTCSALEVRSYALEVPVLCSRSPRVVLSRPYGNCGPKESNVLVCPMLPDIRKILSFLEGFRGSPDCSSDNFSTLLLLWRLFRIYICIYGPIPVAARSNAWACGRSLMGLRVRIPPRTWMSVSCECCVLSGRGFCDGLITRPEGSYRVWCV
jgi:hypothetical protein